MTRACVDETIGQNSVCGQGTVLSPGGRPWPHESKLGPLHSLLPINREHGIFQNALQADLVLFYFALLYFTDVCFTN